MQYALGILGYGGFGVFLRSAWDAMHDVSVVAVADTDPARRPADVRFYTDFRQLLASPDIKIVSIATPPDSHVELACEAMRAGKHVLIEKPVALTVRDANRIREVRDETGRIAAVNFMLRFNPVVEALQGWSRDGIFGRLRRVLVENYAQDESLAPEHWFWDPRISGGILIEHAVHFIDIVNGCTPAPPAFVDGQAVQRNERQEDRMLLTVRYEDGLLMTQYHAFSRPSFFEQTTMRFVFDLAQVEVEGWIPLSGHVTALVNADSETRLADLPGLTVVHRISLDSGAQGALSSGGERYDVRHQLDAEFAVPAPKTEAYADALRMHMKDFIRAIEQPGHMLRVPLELGINSLAVAEAATLKARGGRG